MNFFTQKLDTKPGPPNSQILDCGLFTPQDSDCVGTGEFYA